MAIFMLCSQNKQKMCNLPAAPVWAHPDCQVPVGVGARKPGVTAPERPGVPGFKPGPMNVLYGIYIYIYIWDIYIYGIYNIYIYIWDIYIYMGYIYIYMGYIYIYGIYNIYIWDIYIWDIYIYIWDIYIYMGYIYIWDIYGKCVGNVRDMYGT